MPPRRARSTVRGVAETVTTGAAGPPLFAAGSGPPWRQGRGLPAWVRLVVPVVVIGAVQVGITSLAARNQPEARDIDGWAVALLLGSAASLLLRWRSPAWCLVLAATATVTYWIADYPHGPVFLALLFAFVNAVLRGRRRVAWGTLAAGYIAIAWVEPAFGDGPWPSWPLAGGLLAWVLALGAATELVRSRLERAAEAARTRAEEARRQASDERLRIAQELHDVLAHNISLINVQAGVALHLLDDQPEQARPALTAIRDASKDALGELRSVLDILRAGESAPRAPTTGLRDLDALVERARGTGLTVHVDAPGGTDGLAPGVDLAAFRIVQESITNVVRHAGAHEATVRLRRDGGDLLIQIDDDGRPRPDGGGSDGGGRGIAGMRERARALGGSLEAGPRPGRGFRVRARLPLAGTSGGAS
jgi:signal transduction histidine kinase